MTPPPLVGEREEAEEAALDPPFVPPPPRFFPPFLARRQNLNPGLGSETKLESSAGSNLWCNLCPSAMTLPREAPREGNRPAEAAQPLLLLLPLSGCLPPPPPPPDRSSRPPIAA